MASTSAPARPGFTEAFYADPVRRYMIPVFSDRRTDWPSHPYAQRDSLPEAGQAWWRTERSQPRADSGAVVSLANATG